MVVSSIIKIFSAPLEFIHWIKWILAYVAIRIYTFFEKRRFDLYDIHALGDPVKLGFVIPPIERELESPFPESHLQDSADEVLFYGVNSKSECLLVRIARGLNQVADAWIYLKLANGKTYNLTETMGYQQTADGRTFSSGKLQMHYLSPMRRWRIFFCGMLKETSDNKADEEVVFVKFVLTWKASSDVYDFTMDTNPEGFANAVASADWKVPFVPPVQKLIGALNLYAQTGVVTGTVSVNDGSDYELYLFGEKIRSLGKSSSIVGCQFTTILGCTPSTGLSFQLSNVSAPYSFKNLPFGFVVETDGNLQPLKELDINIEPFAGKKSRGSFNVHFSTREQYDLSGRIEEPIVFYSGQGWSGYLDLSFIKFKVKNRKGYGLILSGEVYKEPKRPVKMIPSSPVPKSIPLSVQFTDEASHFGEVSGGKGSSLGMLTQLSKQEKSFIVPKGIVVTTAAYQEFLTPDILDAVKELEDVAHGNQKGDLKQVCNKVTHIVEKSSLPNKICHSILEDMKDIFGEEVNQHKFAVRSSATGEDTAAMSAAGQMDTFLGVQGFKEIFTAVKKCWASQFGHIAVEYKRRNGQILNSPMAVVIQDMVACEVSGVTFTCDPVTNNPSVVTITANYGLGETVVSGSVEPDTFVLRRNINGKLDLEEIIVGAKHQRIIMQDSGGTVIEDIDENSRNESCLSKETALRLAKLSLKIEKFYKSTRDIEWGILNNEIYILQSRPVTNAAAETDNEIKHEFDSPLRCENEYFTVANIGEVMPGATSPLGMDLIIKCFGNILKRTALDKNLPDNFLESKYYNTGILSYYNHMMITVAELITRYGYETPASKGFQISIFGRMIEDPDMLEYAKQKMKEGPQPTIRSQLRYYWVSKKA